MNRGWRGRSGMTWLEAGHGDGPVVAYFHGTAKGTQDLLFPEVADRLGIRLLMADRPGYGTSTPNRDASLADIARMVIADLDDEHIDGFSVIGWSGGGPHALACAAVAPERVAAVGLFASWGPMNPPDPALPTGVRFAMRVAAALPRPAVQTMLLMGMTGGAGMVDDVRRVARPWGFDPEEVAARGRVIVWHAENDPQVPIGPWLRTPGVELNVIPGDAHDVSLELWELALRTLAS